MKICYIANGKSIHTKRWLECFIKRGHDVFLITSNRSHIKGVKGEYVLPLSEKGGFIPRPSFVFRLRKIIKEINPDIVHAHFLIPFGMYGALLNFHPFIVSCWGSDVKPKSMMSRIKSRYILKKSDVVHVQEIFMGRAVKKIYSNANVFIQAWGTKLDIEYAKYKDIEDSKKPSVFCSRNMKPIYNLKILLKAIPLVLKKLDVKFILVSGDLKKLSDISQRNYIIKGILNEEEYKKTLAGCTLFVDTFHPKDELGGHSYGQALLEAMASDTPTLVADRPLLHTEPKWYFGAAFKANDHVDLSNKIINLMTNDELIKQIVKNNRESVIKYFNWDKNMDRIEMVYNELLNF